MAERSKIKAVVKMSDNDNNDIEKFLLKLNESGAGYLECKIQLDILDLGSWIIKFRNSGVIVNNRDIVLVDSIKVDAVLSFKSLHVFWNVVNGGSTIEEEMNKDNIKQTGGSDELLLLRRKLLSTPMARNRGIGSTAVGGGGGSSFSGDTAGSSSDVTAGAGGAAGGNKDPQSRKPRLSSIDGLQPLKSGYLLKRRDIFAGWRCRYFVVYMGRVEYFKDEHDIHPRGIISLIGAEVQPARKVHINGAGEYWGVLVEAKVRSNSFRVASELTGMEGQVEATTWEQVFTVASKAVAAEDGATQSSLGASSGAKSNRARTASEVARGEHHKSPNKTVSASTIGGGGAETRPAGEEITAKGKESGAATAVAAAVSNGTRARTTSESLQEFFTQRRITQMGSSAIVVAGAGYVTNLMGNSQIGLIIVALIASVLIMLIHSK